MKFLAEGLAANGIASLRFDKRGIGTSASAGKEEAKLRFEDYVNDVTGWIDYLAKEKRFTTITVAGHSEGALIGMLVCQNQPKVKGYISVAGAGRPAYEIIEAQVAAQQNPEAVRKEVALSLIHISQHSGNASTTIETPWINVGYSLTGVSDCLLYTSSIIS